MPNPIETAAPFKPRETERLILRAFKQDDFAAVHSYASNDENFKLMLVNPNAEDDTRAFIRYAMNEAVRKPIIHYEFAVVNKATGGLIGGCSIQTEEEAFTNGTAEIGWSLHRAHWKKGFGTEIGKFLLRLGFTELGCRRIIAHCDAENHGSYGVMEKIGMRREGLFIKGRRGNRVLGHVWRDELAYALLADEWHAQHKMD